MSSTLPASWEVTVGRQTFYARVTGQEVVVGSHWGSGHTDNAGSCSVEDFLNGQFHDIVRQDMGPKVLDEMLSAARAVQR